eukprot:COSAG01_NODE_9966_length_2289_cov_1.776712_1_plen_63_part_00
MRSAGGEPESQNQNSDSEGSQTAIACKFQEFAKFPKSAKQEFGSGSDRLTSRAENPAEMCEA